jgi:hypothetical protein
MLIDNNTGGSHGWSVVKTLGKTSVKAKILNFIFSLKAKNCLSASNVGVV